MRNRMWYLIGVVLLAAACNSVVEPESAVVLPGPIHEPPIPQDSPAWNGNPLPPGTIIEPPIPPDSPAWNGDTARGRRHKLT